jgi:hypothetical protein
MSENTSETYTAEQIIAIGGREWKTRDGAKHRVYLEQEVWMPLIGLEVRRYNTGNISSATLKGKPISNSEARRYLDSAGKVYWEAGKLVNAPTWATRGCDVADRIRDGVREAVSHLDQQ